MRTVKNCLKSIAAVGIVLVGALYAKAQPNSIDPTFANGQFTNAGSGPNGMVSASLIQPDGKILVGGKFTRYNSKPMVCIVRLNADGSLDETFQTELVSKTNSLVKCIQLQSDGKIIIGGIITRAGNPAVSVARLQSNGAFDPTFNPGTASSNVYTMTLLPNGKTMIGGDFVNYNGTSRSGIARINADGSLDQTFVSGFASSVNVNAIKLQSNGKLIVAGQFNQYNGVAVKNIIRIEADGARDVAFNPGTGPNNAVYTCAFQSDGKLLIGGGFTTYNEVASNSVARLTADGSLDLSFSVGSGFDGIIGCLAVQSNGKVLAAGGFSKYNATDRYRLARLNTDGSIDLSFDAGETAKSSLTGSNQGLLSTVVVSLEGKVFIGGSFRAHNENARGYCNRLTATGALDSDFYTPTNDVIIYSTVGQPDGKLLVAGEFTHYKGVQRNRIARLNADGSLDTSFDPAKGADATVYATVLQSDGKVVIGGDFIGYNGSLQPKFARLHADGSWDNTYRLESDRILSGTIYCMALQPNGQVIVGGNVAFENSNCNKTNIARLFTTGKMDYTYSEGSTGLCSFVIDGTIYSMALESNGKLIIGGDFRYLKNVMRLNTTGFADAFTIGTGFDGVVYSVSIQPDGKIIAGGTFSNFNGTSANNIARLNSAGTIDNTFNTGSGFSAAVYSTRLQSDGKVLVGGDFTNYKNTSLNRFVRLLSDGTIDPLFDLTLGTNKAIRTIALPADGKIFLGGEFDTYGGKTKSVLVKLNGKECQVSTAVNQNAGTLMAALTGATYQWVECNSNAIIANEVAQSYTPANSGSYAVNITQGACVQQSECFTILATGIEESSATNAVTCFPNPSGGLTYLYVEDASSMIDVSIYDTQGIRVYENASFPSGVNEVLPSLGAGIYLVKVSSSRGTVTKKLVRQ